MTRKQVTPGGLYTLLNRELQQLKPQECARCRMPLPYRIEPPDEVSANWRIGTPSPCSHGCDSIIAEIVARMWPDYELLGPFGRPEP